MPDSSDLHEAPLDHQLEPPEHEELLSAPSSEAVPAARVSIPIKDVGEDSLNGMAGIEPPANDEPPLVIHPESVAALNAAAATETPATPSVVDPAAQAAASGTPKKGGRKKKMGLIVAGILGGIILLGGGAGAAYYGYYLPNLPQNVVARAFMHEFGDNAKTQSAKFEGDFTYKAKDSPIDVGATTFNGETDGAHAFTVTASSSIFTLKPSVTLLTPDSKTFYVKVSGISQAATALAPLLGSAGSSSDSSSSDLSQYAGALAPLIKTIDGKWFSFDKGTVSGSKTASNSTVFNRDDLKVVVDNYKKHMFIVSGKKLGSETIDGQQATHYQVILSGPKLIDFIKAMKESNTKSFPISQDDYNNAVKQINSMDLNKYPLDFWIDKNLNIVQFKFAQTNAKNSFVFRIAFKDQGTPVTVTKPAESQPVSDLLGSLGLGATSGDEAATPAGRDVERKSDIRTLQSKLAEYNALNNGVYPTSLAQLTNTPESACQAPGGSGTCKTPDYGYHAYRSGTKGSVAIATNCSATVPCTNYILYADKSVNSHSAMETITNPYIVTSN